MRLPLVTYACGLAALLNSSASAQHALSARTFEPSLPAVAPSPVPPVIEWWRNGGPRIRPVDERAAAHLRSGLERSSLLRAVAGRVEASSVIVYLAMDRRMSDGLAGRVVFVGSGGGYRYLRAMINPSLPGDQIVATLAHELQHVIEVIEHPEVKSERTLTALYRRIGRANQTAGLPGFETDAALDVGNEVRRELKVGTTAAMAQRAQADWPPSLKGSATAEAARRAAPR